jgi:predicted sugar kinase
MRLEAKKYLHDIKRAADLLAEFTAGKTLSDYVLDAMLRAAVEREFEIIGEALARLAKLDGGLAARSRGAARRQVRRRVTPQIAGDYAIAVGRCRNVRRWIPDSSICR